MDSMTPNSGWASLRNKLDHLKQTIDLRELFSERYPGRFRRMGRWLIGPSPYREDNHPSFAVNEDVYIDFATGEYGDEIDFVRREQGASFSEAVATLEALAGTDTLAPSSASVPTSSFSEPPPAIWQEIMHDECLRAAAILFSRRADARQARRWLEQRGLTEATIRQAQLGFNPDWHRTRLRDQSTGKHVSIPPGITIPCSAEGALWAVHVRTVPEIRAFTTAEGEPLPKYLYVRGSKAGTLYRGDCLQAGSDVLLVEGEFDVLLAQQLLGDLVQVMTLGSAANRLPTRWLTKLKQAHNVYSCLDHDEAGERATAMLIEYLGDQHQALALPQGKDVTEFVTNFGGNLSTWWNIVTVPEASQLHQLSLWDDSNQHSREA